MPQENIKLISEGLFYPLLQEVSVHKGQISMNGEAYINLEHLPTVKYKIQPSIISDGKDSKTSEIIGLKNQNAIETLEKNCGTLEKSLDSLVQQHQGEERMSKHATELKVNDTNTAEEFTNDETALLTAALENLMLDEEDKAKAPLQKSKYEGRLDFTDKRVDEDIYIMDFRKVDAQRITELRTFFRENAEARSLDLSGNPLDSHRCMLATLKYLKVATNLTDLNLSSCEAHTWPWAEGLSAFLTQNPTLTNLNLASNEIRGVPDIQGLAKALESNSTLTSLNLANNGVGGVKDARAFSDMLKINTALTDLNLANNEIIKLSWEDELSEALKYNTTLKTLNLLGNNIKSGALPLEEIKVEVLIAPSDEENGFFFMEEAWLKCMATQAGLSGELQGESNES